MLRSCKLPTPAAAAASCRARDSSTATGARSLMTHWNVAVRVAIMIGVAALTITGKLLRVAPGSNHGTDRRYTC